MYFLYKRMFITYWLVGFCAANQNFSLFFAKTLRVVSISITLSTYGRAYLYTGCPRHNLLDLIKWDVPAWL